MKQVLTGFYFAQMPTYRNPWAWQAKKTAKANHIDAFGEAQTSKLEAAVI